jgi:F-type H+-transporting ATPase subunit b
MRARLATLILFTAAALWSARPAAAQEGHGAAAGEHAAEAGGEGGEAHEAHEDPSRHFNFFGFEPGHLFDYLGKDEWGGPFGDGKNEDPVTHEVAHEEEKAGPPFVFMLLNFAILLFILAKAGKPTVEKLAADRHDEIKTALDEAAKLRKQAADKLAEYEGKLKDADAQIKQLVDGMKADAKNEEQRILAAAEAAAAQMKREAETRIAAEIEAARAQLTREVTAAAVAATERILREKTTPTDQQALVNAFITDVAAAASPGRGQGAR